MPDKPIQFTNGAPVHYDWGKVERIEFDDRPGKFFYRFRLNGSPIIHEVCGTDYKPLDGEATLTEEMLKIMVEVAQYEPR